MDNVGEKGCATLNVTCLVCFKTPLYASLEAIKHMYISTARSAQ